jgi:hypothetical protein
MHFYFDSWRSKSHEGKKCKDFETGIVKISAEEEGWMTPDEREACKMFLIEVSNQVEISHTEPKGLDLLANKLSERKRAKFETRYMNVDWINPTSNIVERLFSAAGRIMRPDRAGMDPSTLESVLFLIMNRDLWASSTKLDEALSENLEGTYGNFDEKANMQAWLDENYN